MYIVDPRQMYQILKRIIVFLSLLITVCESQRLLLLLILSAVPDILLVLPPQVPIQLHTILRNLDILDVLKLPWYYKILMVISGYPDYGIKQHQSPINL